MIFPRGSKAEIGITESLEKVTIKGKFQSIFTGLNDIHNWMTKLDTTILYSSQQLHDVTSI